MNTNNYGENEYSSTLRIDQSSLKVVVFEFMYYIVSEDD